jgi:hypothetical protein
VARAKGVRSDEETRQLNARIEQLTAVLEGINGEHSMLLEQAGGFALLLLRAANVHSATAKLSWRRCGRCTSLCPAHAWTPAAHHQLMGRQWCLHSRVALPALRMQLPGAPCS